MYGAKINPTNTNSSINHKPTRLKMCFGSGFFDGIMPSPPRREKYKNEKKYQRDYARYEQKLENYMDKDNRRRRLANSKAGALGAATMGSGGC